MDKIDKIRDKVRELDSEFYSFSALYNLHIIEIRSTFNNSILKAYEDNLNKEYDLATMINDNQILFHFTHNRDSKVLNLSINMCHNIWKIFIKEIEKLSLSHSADEFYNNLNDKDFIKITVSNISNHNIYFTTNNKNIQSRNLQFSYKQKSREEKNFIINNKEIWIYISAKTRNAIKMNKHNLTSSNTKITMIVNPFSAMFVNKIVSDLLNKISDKTSGKILIKAVHTNEDKKVITLKISKFIPISFMEYIREYVYKNTMYGVQFADNK